MLALLAAASQRLPESRWKARAGRVLARATPHHVVETSLGDGTRMLLDARGRTEGGPVWNGTYEPHLVALLERLTPPGGTVLDVGANVGLIAVPLARRLAPTNGRVIAVEPIPENADRIERSAALNGLELTVHRVALGDRHQHVRMRREDGWGATTGNAVLEQVASVIPTGVDHDVEMLTLDELAPELGPVDVIKIDAEGADILILQGAKNYLTTTRPIVHAEFSRGLTPGFGQTFLDVVPLCSELRYRIAGFDAAGRPAEREAEVGLRDVLLVPEERLEHVLRALH